MGAVAVARLRFYFEFLSHVIVVCPQLFYFGLPQQKPPLLDRCFMVLSIVLLSADKKPLLKGFFLFPLFSGFDCCLLV